MTASMKSLKKNHPVYEYDVAMPDDEAVWIAFIGFGLGIVEYNGIHVDLKPRTKTSNVILLRIPGGETQFILDGRCQYGNIIATYNMIPFNYNFENGKLYTLNATGIYIDVYVSEDINYSSIHRNYRVARFDMAAGQRPRDF